MYYNRSNLATQGALSIFIFHRTQGGAALALGYFLFVRLRRTLQGAA